jgi:hypothetical protein
MIHDPTLLRKLDDLPEETFNGQVYRATRKNLDPLVTSRSGGRWMPPSICSVLYTSLQRDGALAEISFHWAQHSPRPSKPATVHTLKVAAERTLRLLRVDLTALGVPESAYSAINNPRTQEIGAAVEFLGCDGLIAPSARWDCENLILFPESYSFRGSLEPIAEEDVDWLSWARAKGLVED